MGVFPGVTGVMSAIVGRRFQAVLGAQARNTNALALAAGGVSVLAAGCFVSKLATSHCDDKLLEPRRASTVKFTESSTCVRHPFLILRWRDPSRIFTLTRWLWPVDEEMAVVGE